MVRTLNEPLPTPIRPTAIASSSTVHNNAGPSTTSRIPVRSTTTKGTSIPLPRPSTVKKRPILGERGDNTSIPLPISDLAKRKARPSRIIINPIPSTSTAAQPPLSRSTSGASSIRAPFAAASPTLPRISRPSFARLDAGMDGDVTQLLDYRPSSPVGGIEDDWFSGAEEVGNVTAGRTPMPRKSAGGWGRAVEGTGRMMTPMNSQELPVTISSVNASQSKRSTVSRLPTPPSSQPSEVVLTPQRPSPASRRRARPSPTPPRQTSAGPSNIVFKIAQPSPNPRTRKNPRLSSNKDVDTSRGSTTPARDSEPAQPVSTVASRRKSKARASASAPGYQLGFSQATPGPSKLKAASQPVISSFRDTPPIEPFASSSQPSSRRKSVASTKKRSPKPRARKSRSTTPPSALARYAGVDPRRKSFTPAALRKVIGRDIDIGAGIEEGESTPGDDPLLLKPSYEGESDTEVDEEDEQTGEGRSLLGRSIRALQSHPEPRSMTMGKGKGKARASLSAPDLSASTRSKLPGTGSRTVTTSFPFLPYTNAPAPPRLVPEWVPRTMKKKKVELDYDLPGPSGQKDAEDDAQSFDYEAGGYADGFGSDAGSDFGGYAGDDTFMNILTRRDAEGVNGDGDGRDRTPEQEEEEGGLSLLNTPAAYRQTPDQSPDIHLDNGRTSTTPRSPLSPISPLHDQSFSVDRLPSPPAAPSPSPSSALSRQNDPHTAEDADVEIPERHVSPYHQDDLDEAIQEVFGADADAADDLPDHFEQGPADESPLDEPAGDLPDEDTAEEMDTTVEADLSAEECDTTVEADVTGATLDGAPEVWDESADSVTGPLGGRGPDDMEEDEEESMEVLAEEEEAAGHQAVDEAHHIKEGYEEVMAQPAHESGYLGLELGLPAGADDHGLIERVTVNLIQHTTVSVTSLFSVARTVEQSPTVAPTPDLSPLASPPLSPIRISDAPVSFSPGRHALHLSPVVAQIPRPLHVAVVRPSSPIAPHSTRASPSVAHSSPSAGHVSADAADEGDLTVDAIEKGWESDESMVAVKEADERMADQEGEEEEVSGLIDEENEAGAKVNAIEAEASAAQLSSEQPGQGEVDLGAGRPAEHDDTGSTPEPNSPCISAAAEQSSPMVSQSILAHSAVGSNDARQPASPLPPTETEQERPDSQSASASSPQVPPPSGADGEKIILKLITTIVKVEPEAEEVDEEESEGETMSEEMSDEGEEQDDEEPEHDDESTSGAEGEFDAEEISLNDVGGGFERVPTRSPTADTDPEPSTPDAEVSQPSNLDAPTAPTTQTVPLTPRRANAPLSTTPLISPPLSMIATHHSNSPARRQPSEAPVPQSYQVASPRRMRSPAPAAGPSSATTDLMIRRPSANSIRPSGLSHQITGDTPEASPARPIASSSVSAIQPESSTSGSRQLDESPFLDEGVSVRSAGRSLLAEMARAGGRGKEKELRGVVEVSSLDPRAAARAAAILKMNHNYIEHGILPSSSASPPLDQSRASRSASPNKAASRRKSYTSQHFESVASARMLTAEELLNEAELEIVINEPERASMPGRRRREGTASSAISGVSGLTDMPVPGGWVRTPKRKRSRQPAVSEHSEGVAPGASGSERAWGIAEWKRLESVYKAEKEAWVKEREVKAMPGGLMSWARRSTGIGTPTGEVKEWDEGRVVRRFLESEGVANGPAWEEDVITLRVQALERRVASKSASTERTVTPESPKKRTKLAVPADTPQRLTFGQATAAPPSTMKRVFGWVWGSGSGSTDSAPEDLVSETSGPRDKGKARQEGERPADNSSFTLGRPILPVAIPRAPVPTMKQVVSKPTSLTIPPPPRSTLPRMTGRPAEISTSSAQSINVASSRETSQPGSALSRPAEAAVPARSSFSAADTSGNMSTLGLSTSSSATSGTFPPITPRIYPSLNQSISQRSAAIKALFPSIHPLGDSTSSTSSNASTAANTTTGSGRDTSFSRPISIPGLAKKTSVKDLAKSFQEKGVLENALRRVPSGQGELEALKRVMSRERR